ncbi:PML protein, partial [Menura novaehollandiae]|nr:PML protein [Menura novaehollandiae]
PPSLPKVLEDGSPRGDADAAAAPTETRSQAGTPWPSPPSQPPETEDDFQFLLCEGCRQESPHLKLLGCLHTLCQGCLSREGAGQCPVCHTAIPQASGTPGMANVLFTNLRARLKVYERVVGGGDLSCDNCRKNGEFWCSECSEFLCTSCFQAHQRYLRGDSHWARRVTDIRAGSAQDFLEGIRGTWNLSCSNPAHRSQPGRVGSLGCPGQGQGLHSMVAAGPPSWGPCTALARPWQVPGRREGAPAGRAPRAPRSRRREAKRGGREGRDSRWEEARRELRERIRESAERLERLVRREAEELEALLEARQEGARRELAAELRRVEGVLGRMEAAERLVEKLSRYGTEQEVMDMQPFIKGALQELQRLRPPAVAELGEPGEFSECRARLEAL